MKELSEDSQKLASTIFTWGKGHLMSKKDAYETIATAFDDSDEGLRLYKLDIMVRPWLTSWFKDWEENYFQKEGFNEWEEERLREAMDEIGEIFQGND